MEKEIVGDGQDEQKVQFEPCKYRNTQEESNPGRGRDGKCKYMDNYGNCIFENCIYDQEETPPHVVEWHYTCVVCHRPEVIDPKKMKIHWCTSCIARANDAEVLPFTCRYCGRRQNHPSAWFLSKVCDSCIPKLYDPNCRQYGCKNFRP